MAESILGSVKSACDIVADDTSFDGKLIMYTNAIFSVVSDLGIGPAGGYSIVDDTATWEAFAATDPQLTGDVDLLNSLKLYVGLRVRNLFDPPTLSFVIEAMDRQVDEFTSRISMKREGKSWVDPNPAPTPAPDPWM
jgi:hypothetical protein